jgi:hypothetical protein
MPIKLSGSTSGYAQIQAAATAANNTLTLPSGNGMLVGQSTTTAPTNGQIPIGNGTDYTPATITAGTGITVTNGAGSISIANTTAPVTSVNTFTGAVQSVIVSGTAVASTSGISITFSSIPSWVKRITVMFNGVSTNGASGVLAQLGSGSLTTSGYNTGAARFGASALSGTNSTSGILINSVGANVTLYGNMIITNITGNVWTASYVFGAAGSGGGNYVFTGGGQVSLSGALDRVAAVTANGTDAFNAGSINILYE